ncbi:hypothetical protein MMPV_000836 [Pyropia vietnamensis]
MEVTASTLPSILSDLSADLSCCSFAAFDVEFTGLPPVTPLHGDTPQSRYTACVGPPASHSHSSSAGEGPTSSEGLRSSRQFPSSPAAKSHAEQFPPCQFGLAIFRHDPVSGAWQVRPYSFPLVRRPVYPPRGGRFPLVDASFSLSASTVGFLSGVGFNFSRTFAKGCSWLRPDEEVIARSALTSHVVKTRDAVSLRSLRPPETAYLVTTATTIRNWLGNAARKSQRLELEASSSAFRRKLVYDLLEREFPMLEPRASADKTKLTLTVMGAEQQAAYAAARSSRDGGDVDKVLEEAVGFRRVIDLLASKRVLLVGHNCWMDLIKCVSAFVAPPPPSLPAFKALVRSGLTPHLIDTKHLAAVASRSPDTPRALRVALAESGTGLEEAARALATAAAASNIGKGAKEGAEGMEGMRRVTLESTAFASGFRGYQTLALSEATNQYHDAGYDAYETGRLFLNLAAAITGVGGSRLDGRIRELSAPRLGGPSPSAGQSPGASGGCVGGPALDDDANVGEGADCLLLPLLVNRVPLPRCGGYQYVDFGDTSGADEVNEWENRTDVLHLSGVFPPADAAGAAAAAPVSAATGDGVTPPSPSLPPRQMSQEAVLSVLADALPSSTERPSLWWLAPPGTLLLVAAAADPAARTDPATAAAVAAAVAPRGWRVETYGAYLSRARAADAAALGQDASSGGEGGLPVKRPREALCSQAGRAGGVPATAEDVGSGPPAKRVRLDGAADGSLSSADEREDRAREAVGLGVSAADATPPVSPLAAVEAAPVPEEEDLGVVVTLAATPDAGGA